MIGSKLVVFRYVALRLLGSLLGSALSLTIDVYIDWCGRACCAVFFVFAAALVLAPRSVRGSWPRLV
jgi:hypothetical protein